MRRMDRRVRLVLGSGRLPRPVVVVRGGSRAGENREGMLEDHFELVLHSKEFQKRDLEEKRSSGVWCWRLRCFCVCFRVNHELKVDMGFVVGIEATHSKYLFHSALLAHVVYYPVRNLVLVFPDPCLSCVPYHAFASAIAVIAHSELEDSCFEDLVPLVHLVLASASPHY